MLAGEILLMFLVWHDVLIANSLYDTRLQGIMVFVFIIVDWIFATINARFLAGASQRELAVYE